MICDPSHCRVKSIGGNTYQPKDEAARRASQYWKPRVAQRPEHRGICAHGRATTGYRPVEGHCRVRLGCSIHGDRLLAKNGRRRAVAKTNCARILGRGVAGAHYDRLGDFLRSFANDGCFLLDMRFLLNGLWSMVQIANAHQKRRRVNHACAARPSSTRRGWETMKGLSEKTALLRGPAAWLTRAGAHRARLSAATVPKAAFPRNVCVNAHG